MLQGAWGCFPSFISRCSHLYQVWSCYYIFFLVTFHLNQKQTTKLWKKKKNNCYKERSWSLEEERWFGGKDDIMVSFQSLSYQEYLSFFPHPSSLGRDWRQHDLRSSGDLASHPGPFTAVWSWESHRCSVSTASSSLPWGEHLLSGVVRTVQAAHSYAVLQSQVFILAEPLCFLFHLPPPLASFLCTPSSVRFGLFLSFLTV